MPFLSNVLSVFGTRIFLIVISILSSIIVTRILGPTNRGIMEVLLLVPYLLVSFGNLGIGNANLYFIGKNRYPLEKLTSNSFSLSLMLGLGLVVIAYSAFEYYRDTIFSETSFSYTYLAFGIIPFLLFQKFIQYTFLGKEEIGTRNIIILIPAIINFVFIICVVVILELNIFGVLIATFASNLSAAMLCYYCISKETKIRLRFDYELFRRSVRFGVVPFLALMVMNLNFKADVFLIKYFLNDTEVGLYGVGVGVVEKIWLLPEALGLVLFSRVSNINEEEADRITPLVCRFSMLGSFVLGAILFFSAHYLIPLVYGKAFEGAVNPLLVLIPGIIAMTMFLVLNGDLAGRGKAWVTLSVFLGSLILNIGLNVIWIPVIGITGAALASTVSYTLGAVSLGVAFAKMNRIKFKNIWMVDKSDICNYFVPLIRNNCPLSRKHNK